MQYIAFHYCAELGESFMTLMCGAPLTVFCMSGDSTCSRIEEIEHQRPAAAVVAVILEPCCCWYIQKPAGENLPT